MKEGRAKYVKQKKKHKTQSICQTKFPQIN